MFLRISSASLLAMLAACSSESGSSGTAAESAVKVPCALADAKTFTSACAVERSSLEGKTILTMRHPDGGFRRLVELDGGKSFAAADGSDEAVIVANGSEIEVTVGGDHYLFSAPVSTPATASDAAKP